MMAPGSGGKPPCQECKFGGLTKRKSARRTLVFLHPLTPARSAANRIVRPWWHDDGPGGAVLARTAREPRENQQAIDVAAEYRPGSRFWDFLAYDARVRARARAHMRITRENARTIEPHPFILKIEWFIGSGVVLARFSPEPEIVPLAQPPLAPPSMSIMDGYWACAVSSGARSGLIRGRAAGAAAKTFGDRAAGRPARGRGENDGFPPFSGGADGDVATADVATGSAGRRNPPIRASRRLIANLTTGRGTWRCSMPAGPAGSARGAPIGAEGGRPPQPRRPVTSSFAAAFFAYRFRDAGADLLIEAKGVHGERAPSPIGQTGPGVRVDFPLAGKRWNAGMAGGLESAGHRRAGHASAAQSDVNHRGRMADRRAW